MPNQYSIKIQNNSGNDQNYVIFAKAPIISGSVQSKIWTNVLDSAQTQDTESATFEIYKQYYAVCGNSHGSIEDGVKVTVRGAKNVDLGILNDDGTRTPGTTLKLTVTKNAPFFDLNLPAPTAYPNSFEIDTQPDFTMLEAKQNNYMIGLGGSSSGGDKTPAALFIPQPNVKYQIQPANTYYLAYGDYTPGALIDVAKIGETLAIDFAHHSPIASVVHNAYGALVLQVTE